MEISKKYNPEVAAEKWYNHWIEKEYFHSTPDKRQAFTIVIPPPNVTGVLHMGHMLNNTLQDVLIRRARMMDYNTCWVPGTDHASIATEAKVVQKLASEGIQKSDLTREEFLSHAFEWKNKHGGIILEQLKKLGASCDWKRTKFTMDDDMSESVIQVFVDLYNKGLIYRGVRMVNWDPSAQTALSDEEVIHKEVHSKLFHISYNIEGSDEKINIATTRPETLLGDSAICVNPNDLRYTHLKNKKAIIPLVNRVIPIIFDEYVDMEFGTGALKITPAHDINDYQLGDKHNLKTIDILNDDGTLNKNAQLYVGKDRFEVRKQIATDLEKGGYLVKTEDYQNKVGFSERTDAVIEPKLSMQWFCKMGEFSKPALAHVMNDDIQFHPTKFKNTYRHWIENIKDWCVSRQLWWGQQIPAFYYEGNKFVVAKTKEEALVLAQKENSNITISDLRQDEDVLDTWFSSWLWPISVFDGIRNPDNEEINYYYPTNDLVTAPEILFFWVARMIMAGYEYQGDLPFKNVYLTGIVRDKQGRKMSKSLGNSPDPIKLMEKYGADGVRVGMLLCSPAGNDLPFDESLCEQGRNFSNKIWNAFRLIKGWEVRDVPQPDSAKQAIIWFENKINKTILEIDESYSKYRISEALMSTYKLVWDDFCSWYLEIIKPNYGSPIDTITYNKTIEQLEKVLKLLHPFMPFLSEEIWHLIDDRTNDIIVADWPKVEKVEEILLDDFDIVAEAVSSIRNFRKQKQIPNKEQLSLLVKENKKLYRNMDPIICKLGNVDSIEYVSEKPSKAYSFMVKANEYFIPLFESINVEAELEKLQKELNYTKGFLKSVEVKLSNEKFVQNAPQPLVDKEKKKQADAKAKIEILVDKIAALSDA
ncbi:MAG: valine--tRNA ligase [Flavobacteriales bacterium TMED123]|nr:MAG: valine--tRNA ligase [Flavobacteriales bacterium TMED123]